MTSNTRTPLPEGRVVPSGRPGGWLADRWMANLKTADPARMARGRTWAKGGRVHDVEVTPALATARVLDGEDKEVSIRVAPWEPSEWKHLVGVLRTRLSWVAALLEGELPQTLFEAVEQAGLRLLPAKKELDSSCDCEDWVMPCAHVAAVHAVLADALDGDPFLLLTLRGRSRDNVLGDLHAAWGSGTTRAAEAPVDDPPAGDWFRSPQPVSLKYDFSSPLTTAAGLKALGSPPGGSELVRGLSPLYEAGARAARELALQDAPEGATTRHAPAVVLQEPQLFQDEPAELADEPMDPPTGEDGLTELLVDRLAEAPGAKSQDLADTLGLPVLRVRHELIELEKLGIVYRTGNTRGTRWWLG
jgi:uncharacterized Zn finger protein